MSYTNQSYYINLNTGSVRYGNILPSVLPTDKDNDTYIRTSNGLSTGTYINMYKFDGMVWYAITDKEEVVKVSGATLPITFPVTTIPGLPVFVPNIPANSNYVYEITNGVNIVYAKWNGSQYISSVNPTNSSNTISATSAFTNAIVNTSINIGEFVFRYSQNSAGGNLQIISSSNTTIAYIWMGEEYYNGLGSSRNLFTGNGNSNGFSTANYQTLAAGGLGNSEILFYNIVTNTNVYNVKLYSFNSSTVHITVTKLF